MLCRKNRVIFCYYGSHIVARI